MEEEPLVFLSYASPDRERVSVYYDELTNAGLNVWFDRRRLKGGQNWDFEIKRALRQSAIVVVFLSRNSVDRRGYAQREIKIALDQARDRLIDDVYVIPVSIDELPSIPDQFRDIHVVSEVDGDSTAQLVQSIKDQFERIGAAASQTQADANIRWNFTSYSESWLGLPGYDTKYRLVHFHSETYPNIHQIGDVVRGWLSVSTMAARTAMYQQSSDGLNFGQDRFFRTNTWDAACGEPHVKGRVVSFAYSVWWYGAGAAHPNQFWKTFSFTLEPLTYIESLKELFSEEAQDDALAIIAGECRRQLLDVAESDGSEGDPIALDEDWVISGTKSWDDFEAFLFVEDGIEILFAPYHVAAYAYGSQTALVPYKLINQLMPPHYASALDIEYAHVEPRTWPFDPNTSDEASTPDAVAQAVNATADD